MHGRGALGNEEVTAAALEKCQQRWLLLGGGAAQRAHSYFSNRGRIIHVHVHRYRSSVELRSEPPCENASGSGEKQIFWVYQMHSVRHDTKNIGTLRLKRDRTNRCLPYRKLLAVL